MPAQHVHWTSCREPGLVALHRLLGEPPHELADDVKEHDREDEGNRQDENDDGVDAETLAVVRVQAHHGRRRATRSRRSWRVGLVGSLLCGASAVVSSKSGRNAGGRIDMSVEVVGG